MFSGRLDQSATQSASFIRMSMSLSLSKASSSDWRQTQTGVSQRPRPSPARLFQDKARRALWIYAGLCQRHKSSFLVNPHWVWQPYPWKPQAAVVILMYTHTPLQGHRSGLPWQQTDGWRASPLTWLSRLPLMSTSKMICPSSWGVWGRGGLW